MSEVVNTLDCSVMAGTASSLRNLRPILSTSHGTIGAGFVHQGTLFIINHRILIICYHIYTINFIEVSRYNLITSFVKIL